MVPVFGYGNRTESSASSESLFKELRVDIFREERLPIRLDDFIRIHIEAIQGHTNLVIARQQKTDLQAKKEERGIRRSPEAEENWRGQNNPEPITKAKKLTCNLPISFYPKSARNTMDASLPNEEVMIVGKGNGKGQELETASEKPVHKEHMTEETWPDPIGTEPKKKQKTAKPNYLEPDPTISSCNLNSKTKCPVVGHIINGTNSRLKSIRLQQNHYTIVNTCAFDSITQILMCSYADSEYYSEYVESVADDCLYFEMVRNAMRDGITSQFYKKRARILLLVDMFPKQEMGNSTVVNAACTASFLFNELFSRHPSLKEVRTCDGCGKQTERDCSHRRKFTYKRSPIVGRCRDCYTRGFSQV